jgi:hypothetical protein
MVFDVMFGILPVYQVSIITIIFILTFKHPCTIRSVIKFPYACGVRVKVFSSATHCLLSCLRCVCRASIFANRDLLI